MNFIKALSVFVGTVIGVGIFGLPYVASKAGFFVVLFYFVLMTAIAIITHLMFSRVTLGSKKPHRLPGYVNQYLGLRWKQISFLILGMGLVGALLAYLIVGGTFLKLLLSSSLGDNLLIYVLVFFIFGAYLIFKDIKSIAKIEVALLAIFLLLLILFFTKAYQTVNLDYFNKIDFNFITLPYGVVLFSLWGTAIVPEIKEMLKKDAKLLKRVIVVGLLIISVTYLFFIFTVFGTNGPNTSEEAISGLSSILGDNIIKFGLFFGVITCFTSFLTLGLTLKKVFLYDFNLSARYSWFISCFLPLSLFLLGFRHFIGIIGLTGAIAIGCEGIVIVFLYRQFLKKKLGIKMNSAFYVLPLFFIFGILFEIVFFINKV